MRLNFYGKFLSERRFVTQAFPQHMLAMVANSVFMQSPLSLFVPLSSAQLSSHACVEPGDERSRVAFPPAAFDLGKNLVAILIHFQDKGAGGIRRFVARTPNQQVQENRGQSDSLLR